MVTGSERRVPKAVLSHPYWGRKSWKRPLRLKVGAPVDDVLSAWKELHKMFETSLAKIKSVITSWTNVSVAIVPKHTSRCLISNPTMDRLKASTMIASAVIKLTTDNVRELSGAFDDYVHWEQTHQRNHEKMGAVLSLESETCPLMFNYKGKRGSPSPKTNPSRHPPSSAISGIFTPQAETLTSTIGKTKKHLDGGDRSWIS